MYNSTADDVARHIGVKPTTLTEWARKGYPIDSGGRTIRIRLNGAQKVGKFWKFDKHKVIDFIEGNSCEFGKDNINLKTELPRPPRIGLMNSISKTQGIRAQLMEALSGGRG